MQQWHPPTRPAHPHLRIVPAVELEVEMDLKVHFWYSWFTTSHLALSASSSSSRSSSGSSRVCRTHTAAQRSPAQHTTYT
jgi:hypothetical protein